MLFKDMPFVSRAQWRACFASERRGKRWGRSPCSEWSRGQSYASLPERATRKSVSRRKSVSSRRKSVSSRRKMSTRKSTSRRSTRKSVSRR